MRLTYGLNTDTIPPDARAVFGARLIWPNDLVHDRTSWAISDELDWETPRQELQDWLNNGALKQALIEAAALARNYELRSDEDREVVLWGDHPDSKGRIVANPRASHGYLYLAAWLKP